MTAWVNPFTDPTLFAFHGSPLGNWHSIVREGLHFKKTSHGRAYGHGCYHSLSLTTSMYYCNPAGSSTCGDLIWKSSCLSFQSAICLNEIVNAPTEFVSTVGLPFLFKELSANLTPLDTTSCCK